MGFALYRLAQDVKQEDQSKSQNSTLIICNVT